MKFIGIDIGDGESAAAVLEDAGAALPGVVDLGAYRSLLSVVGEVSGKTLVGQDVLLNPKARGVKARFKSRFLTDPKVSETIEQFASGLRVKMTHLLQSDDCCIALGCPAGWTNYDRDRYLKLVRGAGFPNVRTVAESRAAFLYTHYDAQISLLPEELSQPTLVIDIGSSTMDFAYIVEGKETDVGVFGANHLGGGQLDALILEDAVAHSPNREEIEKVFSAFPTWRNYCELEARKLKETYFEKEELWKEQPCTAATTVFADVNAPLKLRFSLDSAKAEELLHTPMEGEGSQTFMQRLREYLDIAVERTADAPVQQLILTGGASRMNFFRQECQAAFPDAKLTICQEPEFSIARGLSIAARLDDSLDRFRRQVEDFFKRGSLQDDIRKNLNFLIKDLMPVLEKRIMEQCVVPLQKEKNMDREQRQEELRDRIRKEFENHPYSPETDEVIARWMEERLTDTQRELDRICESCNVDRADMRLARLGLKVTLERLRVSWLKIPGILRAYPGFGKYQKKQIREALEREMLKPDGEFTRRLAGDLEADLREQIQENVEKVEIHIS